MELERIAIVGTGAWGTALANAMARAGRNVTLAGRDQASADAIAKSRESPRLPGHRIDDRIAIAATDPAVLSAQDAILLAVPSQHLRDAARRVAPALAAGIPVIACAKGIERGTHKFMTQVIAECAPAAAPAILSGPSFAEEVARGLPAAVTLAAGDETMAAALARALGSATFRPYHSTDVRGVEIGGAAKNVLAIAAGIVAGRGLGASAAAALTTRGFAELFRFGRALGARPETLTGLSGLGDLILTCSSAQSRNFSLGIALGQGRSPAQASAATGLAEGAFTAVALVELAREAGVEMPIATAVAAILDGLLNVSDAIENLLTRPFRAEG
ncbi:MAG TPA: NAD(P)H-dependent glycerol-3-phosphate dehydrogenase [Xanthobacteraceae bacterium]|jgi:glycerol-3-phosphate dehydrogenase (NAD(P)+)|nr:NAD(P)H-dependent glycerol-3-phosphate dehydrogenase [Xanthobacteraceae bacterium]